VSADDTLSAPVVSAQTAGFGRAFSRADGRDRVGVPFWNGLLSALGSLAITMAVAFVAILALLAIVVLGTGNMPSLNPGHPVLATGEIISYIAAGWFAWWRLRTMGRAPFRPLRGGDVRAILIGVGVLFLVRVGTAVQLVATHQTNHVQSGFEHFSVVGTLPNVTLVSIALAVLAAVIVAPLVEEIVFRGLLFGAFAPRIGVLAAALVTAAAFGAVHGDLVLFPTLAALGFVSAVAYANTGNLWVSVTLHAANNAIGAIALISTSLHA
jgi:membrane protease YdiL (CAAX protease family)